jgi:hypothetical protein
MDDTDISMNGPRSVAALMHGNFGISPNTSFSVGLDHREIAHVHLDVASGIVDIMSQVVVCCEGGCASTAVSTSSTTYTLSAIASKFWIQPLLESWMDLGGNNRAKIERTAYIKHAELQYDSSVKPGHQSDRHVQSHHLYLLCHNCQ